LEDARIIETIWRVPLTTSLSLLTLVVKRASFALGLAAQPPVLWLCSFLAGPVDQGGHQAHSVVAPLSAPLVAPSEAANSLALSMMNP